MAKPLRDITPKASSKPQSDPSPKAPAEGQFSGKRSSKVAPPDIDDTNLYNWAGGNDGVKFIKKHKIETHYYPYDADAAFTSGKVKQVDMAKHGYKKPADAKVYESSRMKCEGCGKEYEGESCGCNNKVSAPKPGKGPGLLNDKKKLQEVLTKKTSAGKVISDFIHSDNPKFAGKSKEERKKMALGAYYSMHPEKSKKVEENLNYPAVPMLEDGKKKKGKTQKESAPADTQMNLNTTGASFGVTGDGRV